MKSSTATRIRKTQAERDRTHLRRGAADAERRRLRERLRRLKDLANLLLIIRLLDAAKEMGAAMGTVITTNLSRPRHVVETKTTEDKSAEEPKFEYAPARQKGVYRGRYFGLTPHITDLIRDIALPGPSGEEAFSELLKHIPVEVHEWARVMFTDGRDRAFRAAARGNSVGAIETIANMRTAAKRWRWEQDEAVRQKKLEIEKKLKRVNADLNQDEEPDGPPEHNPRM